MQDVNIFEVLGRGRCGFNCSIQSGATTGLGCYLLGPAGNVFLGFRILVLLVSSEDKGFSSQDSGPGQCPAQVTLTRATVKDLQGTSNKVQFLMQEEHWAEPQH